MTARRGFANYMRQAMQTRRLVVQPRMGFAPIDEMRAGLRSVKEALGAAPRIGTVTIDAYTRTGRADLATEALRNGKALNGYPIVSHGAQATVAMLDGLRDEIFPVQVRHGTAFPQHIFRAAADAGFDAIEGGPISYSFPYSRAALSDTIPAWEEAVRLWAENGQRQSLEAHIETFAGCMLGQLAPPSLLVALSVLEGVFFQENGIGNLSLSLAQGTSDDQDIGALLALARLAERHVAPAEWHIVFYTFMGRFPRTAAGAKAIIEASARVAATGGAHRLIVKTVAEAHGIPTVEQNIEALRWARAAADDCEMAISEAAYCWADTIESEARDLIGHTLSTKPNCGAALAAAFERGILDIPYFPHPDNRNEARAALDPDTHALVWATTGRMPLGKTAAAYASHVTSRQFEDILDFNRRRYENGRTDAR